MHTQIKEQYMSIGIFIKTCLQDHEWLKYCLLSIKKYASNFDGLCIITDKDHTNIIEYNSLIESLNGKIIYVDLPTETHPCQDGIGYVEMQTLKLNWHNFCDYDAVLQIDSDCILSSYISPEYFIVNGKYKWFVRTWGTAKYAHIHRKPLNKFVEQECIYEHMPYGGWLLNRQDTEAFHHWVQQKHNCTWRDYLLTVASNDWGKPISDPDLIAMGCEGYTRGSSVYNAYGGFLEINNHNHNYSFINVDEYPVHDYPIHQYWSWGKLTTDIIRDIEQKLITCEVFNLEELSMFDEIFYLQQMPSAYLWLNMIPSTLNWSNKEKLFFHYQTYGINNLCYINRIAYENTLFGDMIIDTEFDHILYSEQYPETSEYFSTSHLPISDRKKLYHHYIHHGSKSNPVFCKNHIELAKQITNIQDPIPHWFTDHVYLSLCPDSKDYYLPQWENIPTIYRLYHHYLHYGQHNRNALIEASQQNSCST